MHGDEWREIKNAEDTAVCTIQNTYRWKQLWVQEGFLIWTTIVYSSIAPLQTFVLLTVDKFDTNVIDRGHLQKKGFEPRLRPELEPCDTSFEERPISSEGLTPLFGIPPCTSGWYQDPSSMLIGWFRTALLDHGSSEAANWELVYGPFEENQVMEAYNSALSKWWWLHVQHGPCLSCWRIWIKQSVWRVLKFRFAAHVMTVWWICSEPLM